VGVVLYQMCTFRQPFEHKEGDFWALVLEKLTKPVVNPRALNPAIPVALSDFILRLMHVEAARRFPSAPAALNALAWARSHQDESMPPWDFEGTV
jgi:hypothetical protein